MWLAYAKQKLTVSAEQESLRARKIASTKPANTFAFVFKNPTQQSGEFHMVLSSRFMNLIFIIIIIIIYLFDLNKYKYIKKHSES